MHKKTLVLGASLKPNRYSNLAINLLTDNKIETVAFGLKAGNVSGIAIDTELIAYKNIHSISLYLNPQRQKEYYNYILALQPKRVLFNPGTENPELMELLDDNNIDYEIACTLVLLRIGNY